MHPAWLHLFGYVGFLAACFLLAFFLSRCPRDNNEPW